MLPPAVIALTCHLESIAYTSAYPSYRCAGAQQSPLGALALLRRATAVDENVVLVEPVVSV